MKKTDAKRADKYALYEASVQAPEHDVEFFERVYKSSLKGEPRRLREDFCGTALICIAWVAAGAKRQAYGVDLEPKVLRYAKKQHLSKQPKQRRARVELIEADVRNPACPPVDIIAAQNFSYCVFKTRAELRRYFEGALAGLAERGVLILDLFGGYESLVDGGHEDLRPLDGFTYVWEQRSYDPINAFGRYVIHFRFPDGSEKEDAFVYDWRLWTIPELRELLDEVGFDRVDVYWEGEDAKGQGTGVYSKQEVGSSDPAWNAYIVGIKGS